MFSRPCRQGPNCEGEGGFREAKIRAWHIREEIRLVHEGNNKMRKQMFNPNGQRSQKYMIPARRMLSETGEGLMPEMQRV